MQTEIPALDLEALRRRIRALKRARTNDAPAPVVFGEPRLDGALPQGGLAGTFPCGAVAGAIRGNGLSSGTMTTRLFASVWLPHWPAERWRRARWFPPSRLPTPIPERTRKRLSGLPTTSGVVFVTLEDETAFANIIVWPGVFERFRRALTVVSLPELLSVIAIL